MFVPPPSLSLCSGSSSRRGKRRRYWSNLLFFRCMFSLIDLILQNVNGKSTYCCCFFNYLTVFHLFIYFWGCGAYIILVANILYSYAIARILYTFAITFKTRLGWNEYYTIPREQQFAVVFVCLHVMKIQSNCSFNWAHQRAGFSTLSRDSSSSVSKFWGHSKPWVHRVSICCLPVGFAPATHRISILSYWSFRFASSLSAWLESCVFNRRHQEHQNNRPWNHDLL